MEAIRVLVTGAGGSAGQNFIESLRFSSHKYYIVGVDSSKYYRKLSTADKTYLIPYYTDRDYIPTLNSIIAKEGIDFVHAQPDTEVKVLASFKHRDGFKMFLPSLTTIILAQDKYQCNKLLKANGVPIPDTLLVSEIKSLRKFFKDNGKFWLRASQGAGSLAALPVINYKQAGAWMDYWGSKGVSKDDFIISEFLPGREFAFQSIWKDGHLLTSAARQRIEYLFQSRMPSGQSSTPTVAYSVHNEAVNKIATDAVKALDPFANGIYCVDLKENKLRVPCVTEINAGRFFTTSFFFTKAGANMPCQYVRLGCGERVTGLRKYNAVPEGLYWIRQIDFPQVLVSEEELES